MAETCNVAFGRYVKLLRDRRGLSLDDVCSRSQSFPETLMKGYLSRVENGHQKLALPKMIPLSRILEVPPEVLVERLELDMELDKIGSPDTAGMNFEALFNAGNDALVEGRRWDSYAYFREGALIASNDALCPRFSSHSEQTLMSQVALVAAAGALGRVRFEVFELRSLGDAPQLQPEQRASMLRELATAERRCGRESESRVTLSKAISLAESIGRSVIRGAVFSTAAKHATADAEYQEAVRYYMRAHDEFKLLSRPIDRARVLNNLAYMYLSAGNHRAARRSVAAAQRVLADQDMQLQFAQSLATLGLIESSEGDHEAALAHLKRASQIAHRLNDKLSRFKFDVEALRVAKLLGNDVAARVISKRLDRQAAWIPRGMDEYRAFVEVRSNPATIP